MMFATQLTLKCYFCLSCRGFFLHVHFMLFLLICAVFSPAEIGKSPKRPTYAMSFIDLKPTKSAKTQSLQTNYNLFITSPDFYDLPELFSNRQIIVYLLLTSVSSSSITICIQIKQKLISIDFYRIDDWDTSSCRLSRSRKSSRSRNGATTSEFLIKMHIAQNVHTLRARIHTSIQHCLHSRFAIEFCSILHCCRWWLLLLVVVVIIIPQ